MEVQKLPIQLACEIVGSQAEMARRLVVSPATVNQWVKGSRPVPVEYCKDIQKFTRGEVTVQSLCPKSWQRIWPELIKGKRTEPWDGITDRRTGPAERRTKYLPKPAQS